MHLTGTVDEAQAAMGLARAEAGPGSELDRLLTSLERDLYVLMAEVTTDPVQPLQAEAGDHPGDRPRWWRPSRTTSTT